MALRLPDILAGVLRRPTAARRSRRAASAVPSASPTAAPGSSPEPVVGQAELITMRRELARELDRLAERTAGAAYGSGR